MKQDWKPGTMIYPLPAVLVSCGSSEEEYNILTVAWVGTICSNPPMCYISVRPERHSYPIIKKNMEFVINLTTKDMAYATDWCGVRSGKEFNKFNEMKLTPGKASVVNAPIIEESPLCIECRVKEIMSLGSHDMFIADVVNVKADEKYLNSETGKFELAQSNLLVYVHGGYYEMGLATDITRVFLCGTKATKKQKEIYSATLKAFLNCYYSKESSGSALDKIARKILKPYEKQGFYFPHSLGHGIGIPVHQAPPIISSYKDKKFPLYKNMTHTIEPGLYCENEPHKFGIRLENSTRHRYDGIKTMVLNNLPADCLMRLR